MLCEWCGFIFLDLYVWHLSQQKEYNGICVINASLLIKCLWLAKSITQKYEAGFWTEPVDIDIFLTIPIVCFKCAEGLGFTNIKSFSGPDSQCRCAIATSVFLTLPTALYVLVWSPKEQRLCALRHLVWLAPSWWHSFSDSVFLCRKQDVLGLIEWKYILLLFMFGVAFY